MVDISKPQENNFHHHFRDFRIKQYVAVYWSGLLSNISFFDLLEIMYKIL